MDELDFANELGESLSDSASGWAGSDSARHEQACGCERLHHNQKFAYIVTVRGITRALYLVSLPVLRRDRDACCERLGATIPFQGFAVSSILRSSDFLGRHTALFVKQHHNLVQLAVKYEMAGTPRKIERFTYTRTMNRGKIQFMDRKIAHSISSHAHSVGTLIAQEKKEEEEKING